MFLMILPIIFVAVSGYYIYNKYVSEKLDCPANNQNVKGLEKAEIKAAIKDVKTKKKELEKEIKELEKERQDILKGSDDDKADKAEEKLDEKKTKIEELTKLETDLKDLEAVEQGGWKAKVPNKLTWNNGLWIGGFIIGLFVLYKIMIAVFRSLFRAVGWEEA